MAEKKCAGKMGSCDNPGTIEAPELGAWFCGDCQAENIDSVIKWFEGKKK